MKRLSTLCVGLFLSGVAASARLKADDAKGPDITSTTVKYSETRRVDHVDEYHGVKVPDPYRWLEDDVRENKDVAAWVEAKNKETFGYLESIPEREPIRKRLNELWNFEKFGTPFKAGGRYYYYHNSGLQNQYANL